MNCLIVLPPARAGAFLAGLAKKTAYILACNGGGEICLKSGVTPDQLIGDLDSLSKECLKQLKLSGVALLSYPAKKDCSDLHLALTQAFSLKVKEVWLYGGEGRGGENDFRPDHFLTNINLLLLGKKLKIRIKWFLSPEIEIRLAEAEEEIVGEIGDTVSLIPLSPQVQKVSLAGFFYPLKAKTLYRADSLTLSNRLAKKRAKIEKGRGDLLICLLRRKYSSY